MKAVEFEASLNADHSLSVPAEIAAQLQTKEPIRVVLLIPEGAKDDDWRRLTAAQFLEGYDESDAVYDQLPAG
jgi:hypothetical protein